LEEKIRKLEEEKLKWDKERKEKQEEEQRQKEDEKQLNELKEKIKNRKVGELSEIIGLRMSRDNVNIQNFKKASIRLSARDRSNTGGSSIRPSVPSITVTSQDTPELEKSVPQNTEQKQEDVFFSISRNFFIFISFLFIFYFSFFYFFIRNKKNQNKKN
jgi:hypothetical protein